MKLVSDSTTPLQKLARQVVRASLGPFVVVDLEIGWSPTVVGSMKGRIDIPGAATGYLFVSLKLLNRAKGSICWQLA